MIGDVPRAADLRCQAPRDRPAPDEMQRARSLPLDERFERVQRPEHVQDDLLLVQVKLGEPPQRVAAKRESLPKTQAVDAGVAQALDPGDGLHRGAFGGGRVEIRPRAPTSRRPSVQSMAKTASVMPDRREA